MNKPLNERSSRHLPRPSALALACAATFAAPALAQGIDPAAPPTQLEPVTVQSNQGSMRPGALREDIVRTESFGERAIERRGATNLTEALDKHPGITVQVECSICNVRNVLLNNLPGRFTTVMIDGVPIFSSVSSAYGLDSIGVRGVERIDVARGAGASLIAPEALAGTVNIISRRPAANEAALRGQIGSFGSRQADLYAAGVFDGAALTATASYNRHDSVDGDGNGVSEYTGYDRRLGGIGYFIDDLGGFALRGRLDLVDEKRNGGALGRDYAAIKADRSGNPFDWSKGVNASPDPSGWLNPADGTLIPYDDGRGGFSEVIFTDRVQFLSVAERRFGDSRLRLAVGAARHEQDSFYEGAFYDAKQDQYYAEASWQAPVADWLLTGGLNYRYEDLRSTGITADGVPVDGIDNYTYRVPAVFAQAYRSFLNDTLELNASLRYDDHNVFGGIWSPRLNALYHHTPALASRFSAGRGFRAPTSFYEQDHGILDTILIRREIERPEVSDNLSYALNYADDRLAVTGSYNYNRIKDFAILDSGASDDQGNPITIFTNAENPVTVQGVDLNLSYLLTPALTVSGGAEFYHYRFDPGTLVFARPEQRAFFALDYDQGAFDLSARLVWTGRMDLLKFGDDGSGSQNRFDFDTTPKRDRSPSFVTLDLRGEYAFSRSFSVYLGADNLLDYKQVDKDSPLFVDGDGAPDVVHVWGPLRGRYLYAGVKLSFQ